MRKKSTLIVCFILFLLPFTANTQTTDSIQSYDDYITTSGGIPISLNVLKNDIYPSNKEFVISRIECDNPVLGFCEFTDSVITYCPYHNHNESVDTVKYYIKYVNALIESDSAYLCIWVLNSHAYDSLTINNINAGVSNCGMLFNRLGYTEYKNQTNWLAMSSRAHFEVPKGSGKHTIWNSSLWIGGKSKDSIYVAAEKYRGDGFDFWSGPVSDIYDLSYLQKWNRVWKVTSDTIQYHFAHYNDNGYIIPESIMSWPGNGDNQYGQEAILAPFIDQNKNGIYEPILGDAPFIRGDQAVFFIFNDDKFSHTASDGEKMQIELHAMVYGFNDPDSVLNNTVFVHYDIYNRSNRDYDHTYIGIVVDFDIGYPWDDYSGCDVEGGYFYGYNGYPIDGDGSQGHYGANPPAQSVAVLGGPYLDSDLDDNPGGECDMSINGMNFGDGIVDNERMGMTGYMSYCYSGGWGPSPEPVAPIDYYNYLNGIWADGFHQKYGGSCNSSNGAIGLDCNFMFPWDSDSCNWGTGGLTPNGGYNQNGLYWNELAVGNHPYDRRGWGTTGPFTFKAGEKQELDIAYAFARDYQPNDTSASLDKLKEYNRLLREMVTNDSIIYLPDHHVGLSDGKFNKIALQIYPNPAGNFISFDGENFSTRQCVIRSIQGSIVYENYLTSSSRQTINVTDFPPGMYIITIYSNSEFYVGKFVKK